MFPLSALPSCVALHSKHGNGGYLRTVHDGSHGGNVVELGGAADNEGCGGVMDPRCRFYLEPSKEHDGLMHVRCCYNNKYWVPQQRGGARGGWIIGTVDEPEEDQSKPSCTLFKPIPFAGEDGSTRFLHSQLGQYAAVLSTSDTSLRPYLRVTHEEEADQDKNYLVDAFTVIDVSEQRLLPRHLAFKGDNGLFLGGTVIEGQYYLQFSKQDIGDPSVLHTVYTNNSDGTVRIKSDYFRLFWRRSPNWIWADSSDTTFSNRNTLFRVNFGHNFIALRNLGNNLFCKRLTAERKTSCLNASVNSVTLEARLQLYEPVVSRQIYDVDFHLNEARIYTTSVEGLENQVIRNETNTTKRTTVTMTYTHTVSSSTWSPTVAAKMGVETTLLRSGIPFAVGGKIEVGSTEFSGSYSWGKPEAEQKQISKQVDVEVPPMKKVTVIVMGSNSACDIPFSYKQKDILVNGQEVVQEFTDGMYSGVKTSTVTFQTKEEDL